MRGSDSACRSSKSLPILIRWIRDRPRGRPGLDEAMSSLQPRRTASGVGIRRMTAAYDQLLEVLKKHLSVPNAEGTLMRSIREAGMRPDAITVADVQQLLLRSSGASVSTSIPCATRARAGARRGRRRRRSGASLAHAGRQDRGRHQRGPTRRQDDLRRLRRAHLHHAQDRDDRERAGAQHRPLHAGRHDRGRRRPREAAALLDPRDGRRPRHPEPRRDHVRSLQEQDGHGARAHRGEAPRRALQDQPGPPGTRIEVEVDL